MKYSYIKPRKKSAFSQKMQILFIVFDVVIFVLFVVYMFLLFKDYRFSKEIYHTNSQIVKLKTDIKTINKDIKDIQKESLFCEKIYTKNTLLKDSVKNLFDLVPQQIVLSEASILDNALILHGITPDKYLYNSMLQAPLHSIYNKGKSDITVLKNGYFKFVSTNYTDEKNETKSF